MKWALIETVAWPSGASRGQAFAAEQADDEVLQQSGWTGEVGRQEARPQERHVAFDRVEPHPPTDEEVPRQHVRPLLGDKVWILEHALEPQQRAGYRAVRPVPGRDSRIENGAKLGGLFEGAGLIKSDVVDVKVYPRRDEHGQPGAHDGLHHRVPGREDHGEPEHLRGEGGQVEAGHDLGEEFGGVRGVAGRESQRGGRSHQPDGGVPPILPRSRFANATLGGCGDGRGTRGTARARAPPRREDGIGRDARGDRAAAHARERCHGTRPRFWSTWRDDQSRTVK